MFSSRRACGGLAGEGRRLAMSDPVRALERSRTFPVRPQYSCAFSASSSSDEFHEILYFPANVGDPDIEQETVQPQCIGARMVTDSPSNVQLRHLHRLRCQGVAWRCDVTTQPAAARTARPQPAGDLMSSPDAVHVWRHRRHQA